MANLRYSSFNNQTSFKLGEQIHNNDKNKMLGFAEKTSNSQPLWISPGQSTLGAFCVCRASIESVKLIDFIIYLFG